jgi:hypothetical protein
MQRRSTKNRDIGKYRMDRHIDAYRGDWGFTESDSLGLCHLTEDEAAEVTPLIIDCVGVDIIIKIAPPVIDRRNPFY